LRSSKSDVDDFLSEVFSLVRSEDYEPANRKKNIDTLALLGWKWKEAVDALLELSYSDYVSGPDPDRGFPNGDNVWVFKKVCENKTIYIKLQIMTHPCKKLFIFSFHIDGW
jgi:hypothetical protein